MNSSRPYLVRALYDWINDNQSTAYIVVDATLPGVFVPEDFVSDGQITLNVGPSAVQNLQLLDEHIEFSARFGGVPMSVHVPMAAVLAIYAKESGEGMSFGREPGMPPTPPENSKHEHTADEGAGQQGKSRASLKVVK